MAVRNTGKQGFAAPGAAQLDRSSDDEPTLVSVDLRQVATVLRRHVWLILATAALTVGGVVFYLHQQQPRYLAKAVIRLVDRRRALTGGLVDTKSTEQATERSTSPLLSQIQVLLSRQVAGQVVDSSEALGLRIQTDGVPAGALKDVHLVPTSTLDSVELRFVAGRVLAKGWSTNPDTVFTGRTSVGQPLQLSGLSLTVVHAPPVPSVTLKVVSRAEATDELLKHLTAKPRAETDVIDVEYESTDNVAAQLLVNRVMHIFKTMNAEAANQQANKRRAFVEDQLRANDSLVADVEKAVGALAAARSKSTPGRDLTPGEQMALTSLEARQQDMRADALVYRNLLSRLTGTPAGKRMQVLQALVASPGVASNVVVTQLYQQLANFQNARDSLTTGPYPAAATNPDVRRLDDRIAAAETSLVQALQSYQTAIEARLAQVDTITRTMKPRVLTDPEAREAGLTAQLNSLRKSGDALREERQQARIAAAAEAGEVEIVDEATVPTVPIGRSPTLKLALGLVAGLLLGAIVAFIVEAVDGLNTSIRRNSEIENLLSLPALGLIPPNAGPAASRWRMLSTFGRKRSPEEAEADELVTLAHTQSANAEAYRSLRTNLLFSQAVHDLRTLVITSGTPAEGKTTTAANLATTFAQQGVRVLLVDCDLRRPRVHTVMGIEREPGLTQLLLEQKTIEQAVRPAGIPNLFILPAGRLPPNPSELLGGTRMKTLLGRLSQSFDLVVLDSPPVLLTPDSAVLGAVCDGVLLVLRAGRTQQQAARETLRQLAAVNAYVVGAVLNDPDSKVPPYDRQYAYGYGADYYSPASAGGA